MCEEPLRCPLPVPPAVREQAEEAGGEEEPSETGRRWVAPPPAALALGIGTRLSPPIVPVI